MLRMLSTLGEPLLGFFAVTALWSLFIGDWRPSPGAGRPVEQNVETPNLPPVWPGFDQITDIYTFGDSWTAQWFDPEGVQPNPKDPFGNIDDWTKNAMRTQAQLHLPTTLYPQEKTKWPYYLATQYNESFIRGYNFAAGSAITDGIVWDRDRGSGSGTFIRTMQQQITMFFYWYVDAEEPRARGWDSPTALYMFETGINDVLLAEARKEDLPVQDILASYKIMIERLYQRDARNFLLFDIPPCEITPQVEDPVLRRRNIDVFNAELERAVAKLQRRFKDATFWLFRADALLQAALEDPTRFEQTRGLKQWDRACSPIIWEPGNANCIYELDEYFWAFDMHPTPIVHSLMAAKIAEDCFGQDPMSGDGGSNGRYCSTFSREGV